MVVEVREWGEEEEESISDIIREIPRYHPELGGEEVGNDKHTVGRVPKATSHFS